MDDAPSFLAAEQPAEADYRSHISGQLDWHTVPLAFVNSPPTVEQTGSAVLIQLFGHKFLVTAGHCLKLIKSGYRFTYVTTESGPSACAVQLNDGMVLDHCGLDDEQVVDGGWILLSEEKATLLESRSRIFLGPQNFGFISASGLPIGADYLGVSGFPIDQVVNDRVPEVRRRTVGCRMDPTPVPSTRVVGDVDRQASPSSTFKLGLPHLDLWDLSGETESIEQPRLTGMSGCGIWVWRAVPPVNAIRPKLIGVLTHHVPQAVEVAGEPRLQIGGVRLGWFLSSIARTMPALTGRIYAGWPETAKH